MGDEADHRRGRAFGEDRRETLRRIGAATLGRAGQLRWIAHEERALGIEKRSLGDRVAELVEATGRVEDLDVELRGSSSIPPRTHRPIDQVTVLAVDERHRVERS